MTINDHDAEVRAAVELCAKEADHWQELTAHNGGKCKCGAYIASAIRAVFLASRQSVHPAVPPVEPAACSTADSPPDKRDKPLRARSMFWGNADSPNTVSVEFETSADAKRFYDAFPRVITPATGDAA